MKITISILEGYLESSRRFLETVEEECNAMKAAYQSKQYEYKAWKAEVDDLTAAIAKLEGKRK